MHAAGNEAQKRAGFPPGRAIQYLRISMPRQLPKQIIWIHQDPPYNPYDMLAAVGCTTLSAGYRPRPAALRQQQPVSLA